MRLAALSCARRVVIEVESEGGQQPLQLKAGHLQRCRRWSHDLRAPERVPRQVGRDPYILAPAARPVAPAPAG